MILLPIPNKEQYQNIPKNEVNAIDIDITQMMVGKQWVKR